MVDISTLLQHNQFLSGGLALGAAGGIAGTLFASLRSIPGQLFSFIKRKVITEIEVLSSDGPLFWLVLDWLNRQEGLKGSRLLTAAIAYHNPDFLQEDDCPMGAAGRWSFSNSYTNKFIVFSPSPGTHFLKYQNQFIWIVRDRDKAHTSGSDRTPTETITFRTFGSSQGVVKELLTDIYNKTYKAKKNSVSIYINSGSNWNKFQTKQSPRNIDSVILEPEKKQDILGSIQRFIDGRESYYNKGIPYHYGMLMEGSPGNGKSSCAEAIATYFSKSLYVLSLNGRKMDDEVLAQLLLEVPENGLLLIEDIDAAFEVRDHTDENSSHVTFSGLLNALDGVIAKDGQIVIMSTNHPEKLDPALMRPGRTDKRVEFTNATEWQARELFSRFFPESSLAHVFGQLGKENSMAYLQGVLLESGEEPAKAVASFQTKSLSEI